MDIFAYEDNIKFKLDYNDQLYSEDYIQKFLDSFNRVLNQFIKSDIDKLMINEIELEREHELPNFTSVENPFIHKRFEEQAEANPKALHLLQQMQH